MPVFQYQAIKVGGERTSGVLTADSPRQAREQLRSQDVYVTDLTTAGRSERRSTFSLPRFRGRNLRAVSLATRQMATMLGTGLPLTEVLSALVEQVEDQSLRAVLRDVQEKVNTGFALADALSDYGAYFDELYVGMVRAGEASGRLSEVLAQLAEFCQRDYRIRSRVTSVLTYPAIMVVVGFAVVFFLLTFVVPRVTAVLQNNKVPLPTSTAILVGTGNFLSENWPYLLLGFIGLWIILNGAKRTERGGWLIDTVKLRIPLIGTLFRKQAVARFSSTLAALLRSGLPALDALGIVREVVGNRVIAKAIDEITEAVTAGQDLSMPLRSSPVFPPMVSYMVATGEQSGELDDVLDKVAEELDEEVEITGQRLISLLEPMLIVFMAVIVGFIVLSIVQPILELSNF
jgi:general secretion pathway protein F